MVDNLRFVLFYLYSFNLPFFWLVLLVIKFYAKLKSSKFNQPEFIGISRINKSSGVQLSVSDSMALFTVE